MMRSRSDGGVCILFKVFVKVCILLCFCALLRTQVKKWSWGVALLNIVSQWGHLDLFRNSILHVGRRWWMNLRINRFLEWESLWMQFEWVSQFMWVIVFAVQLYFRCKNSCTRLEWDDSLILLSILCGIYLFVTYMANEDVRRLVLIGLRAYCVAILSVWTFSLAVKGNSLYEHSLSWWLLI